VKRLLFGVFSVRVRDHVPRGVFVELAKFGLGANGTTLYIALLFAEILAASALSTVVKLLLKDFPHKKSTRQYYKHYT
jgi:hypothetical protein